MRAFRRTGPADVEEILGRASIETVDGTTPAVGPAAVARQPGYFVGGMAGVLNEVRYARAMDESGLGAALGALEGEDGLAFAALARAARSLDAFLLSAEYLEVLELDAPTRVELLDAWEEAQTWEPEPEAPEEPDEPEPEPWVQPGPTNPYPLGARVTDGGQTWESTVARNVWKPGVAGWHIVAPEGGVAPWVQPSGSADTYALGARVAHQGGEWLSRRANNSWEPGTGGSGWLCVSPNPAPWVHVGNEGFPAGHPDGGPMRVTHQGKTWQNPTDGTFWEPGVAVWVEVAA